MTQVNYTQEQTADIVNQYKQGTPVAAIAEATGRKVASIVAKLVREGVYQKPAKQGTQRKHTRHDMCCELAALLNLEQLPETLEKASHSDLQQVVDAVRVLAAR